MTANHRALEESDIRLIERVKLTPSLYDPRNPDFRLAYRKEQDWDNVGAYVGLAAVDARRRWTCLRDRYTRELKQLRLHPEKGEFGKNEFFRLMDFLRKYVRKRRERRRHPMYKYDSSWDGSMGETKLVGKVGRSDEDEEVKTMVEQSYEEEAQQNFDNKLDVETDEYVPEPEYVEVDTSETYEEYVENATTPDTTNCNRRNKTVLPIFLPSQTEGATYTLTTPQHIPTQLQMQHQQHIHTLQQQQTTQQHHHKPTQSPPEVYAETEDDYFCKSVAVYLRQLSRRHKIKAKVEMFQILEKYIELEENPEAGEQEQRS